MIEVNRQGCARIVILTQKYAFKIPNLLGGYKSLLNGLLANLQEKELSTLNWSTLCPVIYSLPLSIIIVMPRCEELSDEEFSSLHLESSQEHPYHTWVCENGYYVKVERKSNSFGRLEGKVVALDYGN